MRIISTTVALLAVLAVIPTAQAAADITNTDTNTNTNISKEISIYTIQNDPFRIDFALAGIAEAAAPEKTPEEIRYEQTLAKWKIKQEHLWKSLSNEPFIINASAYTAAADECGKNDGVTASGVKVQEKRTLACPPMYPFGTKIDIDGFGIFTCEDRGGAIKANHFDIYMKTKKDAFAFGRRNLSATIVQ